MIVTALFFIFLFSLLGNPLDVTALREIGAAIEVDFLSVLQFQMTFAAGGANPQIARIFFGLGPFGDRFDISAGRESDASDEGTALLVFAFDEVFAADGARTTDFFNWSGFLLFDIGALRVVAAGNKRSVTASLIQ